MIAQQKLHKSGTGFALYADCEGVTAVDVHKQMKKKLIVTTARRTVQMASELTGGAFQEIAFGQWLPFAAPVYNVSAKLDDYVMVPVPIMPAGLPNRNGVAFPLSELTKFNVEHGKLAYQTLIGKPVHVEHDNQVPSRAIGVIVDASLRYSKRYKVWKLVALLAIDRTKNPALAEKILSGEQNSYSMGAWVGTVETEPGYSCSYCHAPLGGCTHLHPEQPFDFYMLNGILVFRNVHNVCFFETSSVETPAFSVAVSDMLMRW